jgi:GT2 family glycosyltransferase
MTESQAKAMSVIIVSWNAKDFLRGCLQSIARADPACVEEIIVVDNASHDGSPEMVELEFPEVRLIRAGSNLGFAGGNNLAITAATGATLALVNSDVIVHPGCLETMHDYLIGNPQVGLVGPRVQGGDGKLQRNSRHFPSLGNTLCRALAIDRLLPSRWSFASYEVSPSQHARLHDADVLSGCFWVARREAVEQVGLLDEQFFFYGEDIDWCKRFVQTGWKIVFLPQAEATHFGGGSSSSAHLRLSIEMLRATLKYWRKHHGALGAFACRLLLILHHGSRLAVRSLSRPWGSKTPLHRQRKYAEDMASLRWLTIGEEPGADASNVAANCSPSA